MCDRHRDPLQPDRPDEEKDLDDLEVLQEASAGGLDDWEIERLYGDRDDSAAPGTDWDWELDGPAAEWVMESEEWAASTPSPIPSEFGSPRCAGRIAGAQQWDEALRVDASLYGAYLQSAEWCGRRYDRHWLDRCTCCRCGIRAEDIQAIYRAGGHRGAPFHCHHVAYERRGCEALQDLRTLCCYCHIDVTRPGDNRSRMVAEYGTRPDSWPGTPPVEEDWKRLTIEGADVLWGNSSLVVRPLEREHGEAGEREPDLPL